MEGTTESTARLARLDIAQGTSAFHWQTGPRLTGVGAVAVRDASPESLADLLADIAQQPHQINGLRAILEDAAARVRELGAQRQGARERADQFEATGKQVRAELDRLLARDGALTARVHPQSIDDVDAYIKEFNPDPVWHGPTSTIRAVVQDARNLRKRLAASEAQVSKLAERVQDLDGDLRQRNARKPRSLDDLPSSTCGDIAKWIKARWTHKNLSAELRGEMEQVVTFLEVMDEFHGSLTDALGLPRHPQVQQVFDRIADLKDQAVNSDIHTFRINLRQALREHPAVIRKHPWPIDSNAEIVAAVKQIVAETRDYDRIVGMVREQLDPGETRHVYSVVEEAFAAKRVLKELRAVLHVVPGANIVELAKAQRAEVGRRAEALIAIEQALGLRFKQAGRTLRERVLLLCGAVDALERWRTDVTVALLRPGGTAYADVPALVKKIAEDEKAMRVQRDVARELNVRYIKACGFTAEQFASAEEAEAAMRKMAAIAGAKVMTTPGYYVANTVAYPADYTDLRQLQDRVLKLGKVVPLVDNIRIDIDRDSGPNGFRRHFEFEFVGDGVKRLGLVKWADVARALSILNTVEVS